MVLYNFRTLVLSLVSLPSWLKELAPRKVWRGVVVGGVVAAVRGFVYGTPLGGAQMELSVAAAAATAAMEAPVKVDILHINLLLN